MSFFIRKKSKNLTNLTKPAGEAGGGFSKANGSVHNQKTRQRNTDFKSRPKGSTQNKGFGQKRRNGFGSKGENSFSDKRPKFDKNEEIESSSDEEDDEDAGDLLEGGQKRKNQLKKSPRSDESQDDEFFSAEESFGDESAQEKKLRLAKMYIEEIEKQERAKREDEDVDDDLVASRLKEDVLEAEGRLRKEIAETIEPDLDNITVLTCPKYLKRSVTCLCITDDDKWIFSGSKDGHLIKWSVAEKKKVGMVKKKEVQSKKKKKKGKTLSKPKDPNECHSSTIMSIAVTSDGKFLATGDAERQIVIWDPETLKKIHIFTGHRGAIRGLSFRKKTHTLYSCSDDKSVRVWSLDEMGYVETLFGHQEAVTCIDALSRERALTGGGRDNTIRIWKIVEESQLVYNGHYNGSIDAVKLINEENFLSAGEDGLLCTWNVNRKKPLVALAKPHGSTKSPDDTIELPRWLSSIAAWTNTDLVASGSSDGFIRFWKCGERFKSLTEVFKVPCLGWINSMEFSAALDLSGTKSKFLVVGTAKEHRLGRWFEDIKGAKNSIVIIPLKPKTTTTSSNNMSVDSIGDNSLLTDDED